MILGFVKNNISAKAILAFGHDILAATIAWCIAYWLRFNMDVPPSFYKAMWQTLFWVVPVQSLAFWFFGLYRGIWRYASIPDLKRILLAVGAASMVIAMILYLNQFNETVPRSVLVFDPILLLMLMGGSRLAYRAWSERRIYGLTRLQGKPVLVLGAGLAALTLVKELERSQEWRVVGFLDDDTDKQSRLLLDVKVLGQLDQLPEFAHKLAVGHVIIAMPSASHTVRRKIVEICTVHHLKVMTVPSFDDLMSGKITVSQIREIELDDLLGRDPVTLDDEGLRGLIASRCIMVSGAGGSIGSELCRQIVRFSPKCLILFEMGEFSLYRIEQEFRDEYPDIKIICVIGDVKNATRVGYIINTYQPSVIFHAAAYKHVPLMEEENSWEAVSNNVLGTYTLAKAAVIGKVDKFVMISTDKAVNPTNVMGATKRLAEILCQSLHASDGTRFVIVRFGNVLGSAGSVIPRFREQIAKGGPVTVTHPEITRYFMSIPEAAQLVLQAGLMGVNSEIFVLDMGEPVKIVDLAKDMIRLCGFSEDEIKIVFSGLRPGEKLYEELLADGENTLPTPHAKLRIAESRAVDDETVEQIISWLQQETMSDQDVKKDLRQWVPEYKNHVGPTFPS